MKKLTLADLKAIFETPRHDHPGRKGSVHPKGRNTAKGKNYEPTNNNSRVDSDLRQDSEKS